MPKIHFLPEDKTIESQPDGSILAAFERENVSSTHVCGGRGRCSTCRVMVLSGLGNLPPRQDREESIAEKMAFAPDIRLACQVQPLGDISVRRLVLDEDDIAMTNQLIRGNEKFEGREKHVLVLFSDIRGFTSFSESMLPYDVIHLLNRYFKLMGQAINAHGGHIDNYMGDGIMAVFQGDNPGQATLEAIRAGLGMLENMETFNQHLEKHFKKRLRMGIGLHYGVVVAGSVGSSETKKETIIGDTVNLASRVESANKEAGTEFLISQPTYYLVQEYLKVGKTTSLALKGKSGEYTLYEVLGLDEEKLAARG